jgi:hypothetical protein
MYAQDKQPDSMRLYTTALKLNLNGARLGIEQKIFRRMTVQLEGWYTGRHILKVNPQLRYYPKRFRQYLGYVALGYYYKHQECDFKDSVRMGADPYYAKRFSVTKDIHAFTLNAGFMMDEKVLKHTIRLEWNLGLGVRFKRSFRYGILPEEEIDYREAMFIRPQAYQDTKGNFVAYPEINLSLSIALPVRK